MVEIAAPLPATGPLARWLQLLWGLTPALRSSGAAPYIAAGAIHLPSQVHWRQQAAAAAHAAAHLVYSPRQFDGGGLGAIVRALVGLLEDARVEHLAMRELPGLARLWRPLHGARPETGTDFGSLMQRLARALIDTGYDDPHPWVRKGRALFFVDAELGLLALRTPAEVVRVARRLGHDIGQMRLAFDVAGRAAPAYRDDHRWMWAADLPEPAAPEPREAGIGGTPASDARGTPGAVETPHDDVADTVTRHPEWDRLISRLRPDWCRVVERTLPATAAGPVDDESRLAGRALHATLRTIAAGHRSRVADDDGLPDVGALVDWRVALRQGHRPDLRVAGRARNRPGGASVYLLVDRSASSGLARAPGRPCVLERATRCAAAIALALDALRVPCAIAGFASFGRHAVRFDGVKDFGLPLHPTARGRLEALRAGGSTRLGAALRHATRRLAERRPTPGWLILLSDGEPHDIDVHDGRYLAEDARRAVAAAARRGVRTLCIVPDDAPAGEARRIFGARGTGHARDLRALPATLKTLLG